MIPVLDSYHFVTPEALDQALAELAAHPDARPFAGGTDLMVLLEAGHLPPGHFVDLSRCRELHGIERTDEGGLSIGALTTYTEIRHSPLVAGGFALLQRAAAETGGLATQNRGTIGGNIANASPAADTPPVLIVYDAELELASSSGTRRVPYASFHRGYKQMDLRPGELIARVLLPPPASSRAGARVREYYRKVGTRRAQAISKVCFAGILAFESQADVARAGVGSAIIADVHIALGSVAPTVIRATRTEQALRGRVLDSAAADAAAEALAAEIAPIDDIRSTARYRARVAVNLLREFLESR
jgi:CO/xanthine dehydrogenase FAD-binding subunit